MSYLSQAVVWVRTVLFGPPKPIRRNRTRTAHTHFGQPPQAPVYAAQPTPGTWGATLALARLRRAGHAPALDCRPDRSETHPLVRIYVLPPIERQQALPTRVFADVSR